MKREKRPNPSKIRLISRLISFFLATCFLLYPNLTAYEAYFPKIENNSDSVEDLIKKYSAFNGADPLLALNIAYAESRFDPEARNPSSSAKGVFQFIDSTWENYCDGDVLNAIDNIKCATRLMGQGGYIHWGASAKSWTKLPYVQTIAE